MVHSACWNVGFRCLRNEAANAMGLDSPCDSHRLGTDGVLSAAARSSDYRREELYRAGGSRRTAARRRSKPNPISRFERRFYLAGSYICQQALVSGRIDAYVEYTGTALTAILKQPVCRNPQAVFETVRRLYASRYNIAGCASAGL